MHHTIASHFREAFGRMPDITAAAPGRIEFIGNHVDYNGGLVLGLAVDRHVLVGLGRRDDAGICIRSTSRQEAISVDLGTLAPLTGAERWANYALGVLSVLMEDGLPLANGFDLLIHSTVPEGAGMSSSAALELATAVAVTTALGAAYPRDRLALLCKKVENEFVGVPCGILDQGVSAFGKQDHLVSIDCRGPVFSTVPLPTAARFWLFNTHSSHALVDSLYAERHAECMDALERLRPAQPDADYLTDISPETVEARRADLPEPIYRRARHITGEHVRVRQTLHALEQNNLKAVGRLLLASHESSRDWFENSTPELDFLVNRLSRTSGVLGARLTGGGFGGAVMSLVTGAFTEAHAEAVARDYEQQFGQTPAILECRSANGAHLLHPHLS